MGHGHRRGAALGTLPHVGSCELVCSPWEMEDVTFGVKHLCDGLDHSVSWNLDVLHSVPCNTAEAGESEGHLPPATLLQPTGLRVSRNTLLELLQLLKQCNISVPPRTSHAFLGPLTPILGPLDLPMTSHPKGNAWHSMETSTPHLGSTTRVCPDKGAIPVNYSDPTPPQAHLPTSHFSYCPWIPHPYQCSTGGTWGLLKAELAPHMPIRCKSCLLNHHHHQRQY